MIDAPATYLALGKEMIEQTIRRVPLLDLNAQYQTISDEINAAVLSVLESQQFILGPEVKALESEIAKYCGTAHAVGCASGSDAILLALMALEVGPGDEVVTSPFTFFATAGSIVRLGARPVFVDIDEQSYNIDPSLLTKALTNRTKAILPVHLFGECAGIDQIKAAVSGRSIPIIEDAAQAIGATYFGRPAGGLGLAACFSFYPSKNLGGAGDGGMLTTDDAEFAEKLRVLRGHGARKKYFHEYVGMNSRLDSLQAAILRVKLRHLDDWAAGRRANADRYRSLFARTKLLENGKVKLPSESAGCFHVYNQFVIRTEERDKLQGYLKEKGIGTEVYYPMSLHLQQCFKSLGYRQGDFPESERATKEALAIPVYPELSGEDQEYVVHTIDSFYG